MSVTGIDEAIEKLSNPFTTMENAEKLASLYILKDKLTGQLPSVVNDNTEAELDDILPCYRIYRDHKRKYQLGELSKEIVIDSLKDVCTEIDEFIHTLFSSTDMPQERDQILKMIKELQKIKVP